MGHIIKRRVRFFSYANRALRLWRGFPVATSRLRVFGYTVVWEGVSAMGLPIPIGKSMMPI
jgi:hypothetical protein